MSAIAGPSAAGGLEGGILAAGDGRRLRADGWPMPKALVPVAGVPLLEHVIRNFVSAGITSLSVIVNESTGDLTGWVRARFPRLDVKVVVKTTGSSLESFETIVHPRSRGDLPILVSTVDAWCRVGDFLAFVETASRLPEGSLVLGVTSLVADERPLWVTVAPSGRVTRVGGDRGPFVTAGLYLVPARLRGLSLPPRLGRLRELLGWLVNRGSPSPRFPCRTWWTWTGRRT